MEGHTSLASPLNHSLKDDDKSSLLTGDDVTRNTTNPDHPSKVNYRSLNKSSIRHRIRANEIS